MEEVQGTGDALEASVEVEEGGPAIEAEEDRPLHNHLEAAQRKVVKQRAHLAAAEAEVEAAQAALDAYESGE